MAIMKKSLKTPSKLNEVHRYDQCNFLVLCFLQKLLEECAVINTSINDLIDDSVLKKTLLQLGMPKRLLTSKELLGKQHCLWIEKQVSQVNAKQLTCQNYYQNLNTLAKQTNNPRLYFRLYLFSYLKLMSEPFNDIADELASEYQDDATATFILLRAIGVTDADIQSIATGKNRDDNSISSLLTNNDESIHSAQYSHINVNIFLSRIELPNKYLEAIKTIKKLSSVEALIRHCYQLVYETKLQPKDFVVEQFMPLYQYLDDAISFKKQGVNILLHGEPGVGKTELVKTLAKALNCDLFDISHSHDEYSQDNISKTMVNEIERTQSICGQLKNIIMFVDECDDFFHENPLSGRNLRKHQVNQLLENTPIPTIWVTNRPYSLEDAYIRRFDMVLEVTSPDAESYERKVRQLSRGLRLSSEFIAHICQHKSLSIAHIEKAIKVTKTFYLTASDAQEQITVLLNGYLNAGGYKKLQIQPVNRLLKYDLTLTNSIGHDLKTVQKGIHRLGESRILLYGPPGTGKSAYAKYLSKDLGLPLIMKRGSDLLGAYVGETEKNIAAAFEEAKDKNAILLLDEVDSFLNSREGHSKSWESTMVNEMLTQMETFDGVFIATTNFNQKLDHAVARRFDFKIKLDYLLPAQSLKMFKQFVYSSSKGTREQLLKLNNLTPGDFAVVARKCSLLGKIDEDSVLVLLQQESVYKKPLAKPIGFVIA
jgi:transitional endoplasmic reticulum ATPase